MAIRATREPTSTPTCALRGQCGTSRRARGLTAAQVALAWLLHKGDDIVPIPGTKRRKYLEENVKAAEVRLSDDVLDVLERAFPVGAASGERYPDWAMQWVDRGTPAPDA